MISHMRHDERAARHEGAFADLSLTYNRRIGSRVAIDSEAVLRWMPLPPPKRFLRPAPRSEPTWSNSQ